MRMQAVKIRSTRREEFLGLSTAVWEQSISKEGAVPPIPRNEGIDVRGGMRVFLCIPLAFGRLDPEERSFDGSGDANMSPENFEKSLWFQGGHVVIKAPGEAASTCRSNCPKGELIERRNDHVIASRSLQGEIRNMEVVEDFEWRPHVAVSFVVERHKEIQE